jgi:hypothetical protein
MIPDALQIVRTLAVSLAAVTVFAATFPARAADQFVIDLTYDSLMDMVRPERHPDIQVHHVLHVTVSPNSGLSEQRNRSTKQYYDRNAMAQVLDSTGDDTTYASWRAAPNGTLVREQNDPQSTRTMTVTLLPDDTCRLDVIDHLKPGFTEYEFLRISSHTMGFFSSYRVVSTSCKIRPTP